MKENSASKKRKNIKAAIFLLISLIFVAIAVLFAVVGISYLGNRKFTETFYSVSSLKVNNKVRIIQISDLHNCTYGEENAYLIERVQKLQPDIIVLTGDCTDADSESVDEIVDLCKAFADIAPSFYIYGNNEIETYYSYALTQDAIDKQFGFNDKNRDPNKLTEKRDILTKKLNSVGVVVLKNSAATVTVGETPVDVYGVLTSNPSAF